MALKLVPDMETWYADGKDLRHVHIYAVDKKGRRVLNVKDAKAFDKLTFTVKGDANIVAVQLFRAMRRPQFVGRVTRRTHAFRLF